MSSLGGTTPLRGITKLTANWSVLSPIILNNRSNARSHSQMASHTKTECLCNLYDFDAVAKKQASGAKALLPKDPSQFNIHEAVKPLVSDLVATRRYLHQHPETSFKEFKTSEYVYERLTALPTLSGHSEGCITVVKNIGKLGVVGYTYGTGPRCDYRASTSPGAAESAEDDVYCILLRADMDGLPLTQTPTERNKDYISQNPGAMHACGHDGHMSMLLAAATIITSDAFRATLPSNFCVKFCFQPAEEMFGGAKYMCDDGVLERGVTGPYVHSVFGIHLWTYAPLGHILLRNGSLMAANDRIFITVKGQGGHGAVPQGTKDAIVCTAQMVTALQTIVSRNVAPLESGVVTIGTINGGYNGNIIADRVEMVGTVRSLNIATQLLMKQRVHEICNGIAGAFGCEVEIKYLHDYPITVNEQSCVDIVADVAEQTVGKDTVDTNVQPTMGAEDFAFFLQQRKGCFFFVGACPDGEVGKYPHHKSTFDVDEDALPVGATMFLRIVEKIAAQCRGEHS